MMVTTSQWSVESTSSDRVKDHLAYLTVQYLNGDFAQREEKDSMSLILNMRTLLTRWASNCEPKRTNAPHENFSGLPNMRPILLGDSLANSNNASMDIAVLPAGAAPTISSAKPISATQAVSVSKPVSGRPVVNKTRTVSDGGPTIIRSLAALLIINFFLITLFR